MEINLELLKNILIEIKERKIDENIRKEYKDREIFSYDELIELIAEDYKLVKCTRYPPNFNKSPVCSFNGLTDQGDSFLKAIEHEEIYNEIEPLVSKVGFNSVINKAIQLHEEKYDIYPSEVASKNITNNYLQDVNFGGGFAVRDYNGNVINNHSNENISQTVEKIDNLIRDLSQNSPVNTTSQQMLVATQAIATIENDLDWKQKAIQAAKQGSLEMLKGNPVGAFVAGAIEGWNS